MRTKRKIEDREESFELQPFDPDGDLDPRFSEWLMACRFPTELTS